MFWNYRLRKRKLTYKNHSTDWFDVVEYFPTDINDKMGEGSWTIDGMKPEGESKQEVIECLENMLKDIKQYDVLEDDNNEVDQ